MEIPLHRNLFKDSPDTPSTRTPISKIFVIDKIRIDDSMDDSIASASSLGAKTRTPKAPNMQNVIQNSIEVSQLDLGAVVDESVEEPASNKSNTRTHESCNKSSNSNESESESESESERTEDSQETEESYETSEEGEASKRLTKKSDIDAGESDECLVVSSVQYISILFSRKTSNSGRTISEDIWRLHGHGP